MDPNPLLTTTATAAAALVAIVGGLLVSRVISLATERSGLEQRLTDLQAQLTAAEARRDAFEDRLLRWDVQEVLWEGREQFAQGGDLDIQAMIDEARVDRTVAEVQSFVEEEVERYQAIREHLESVFADGHPGFSFDEVPEQHAIQIDPEDEAAYELVWKVLEQENPKPARHRDRFGIDPALLIGLNSPTVHAIRNTAQANEHATLRRDADEARHEVDALKVQIEQTELAAARVVRPQGVRAGLWVLGYVTFTGVLIPLSLTAFGLESMTRWGGAAIVVLFGSGLALLMAYVGVEVHRLTVGDSDL